MVIRINRCRNVVFYVETLTLRRRSGVLTDVQLVEIRYDGDAAAVLRAAKAIFFGLIMNCIVCGWVILVSYDTFIQGCLLTVHPTPRQWRL